MESDAFDFGDFHLDLANRRLSRDGETVELNARYLDALALLVRDHGRLVSKDRFLQEVWRGTPVTDEALTQCIRSIRRQLGDDASRPRFIETVPKYGYRFIASVSSDVTSKASPIVPPSAKPPRTWPLSLAVAGAAGGAGAGALGGLLYGVVGSAHAPSSGMGAGSIALVLTVITALVGLTGGAGVGLGVAAADRASQQRGLWTVAGGAWGGMMIGAVVKLVGLDAFSLLLGRTPGEITGAVEGAFLGGAVGLAAWLARRGPRPASLARGMAVAALAGGAAGGLIVGLGGRLMGGSLVGLAQRFPGSRLGLDGIGALFGERAFGALTQGVTGVLEGALFSACVVGAMILTDRRAARTP
jgi:DNA-binding winged helix-turn-helix (wHTH) protein